jgi:murein DD-endopeptidase MepM/ murein hydrolase activator NlpD
MIIRALTALVFLAFAAVSQAATLKEGPLSATVPEAVGEGDPFLVEVRLDNQVEKVTVEWLGKAVDVTMAKREGAFRGEVLLGAGLGCPHGEQTIVVEAVRPNRRELVLGKIRVDAVEFPEQRLKLPPKMVTPSKEDSARIKREQEMITKALSEVSPRRFWSFPFARPVPGDVTSAFGLRRVLNGQPRSPHSGLDLDGKTGDAVAAANQGKVILVGDFYFNGKSVFVDHGQGVISMYFHLSRVDVSLGQHVERGHQVGQVGASGRATGPHLHFGMKILGQAVDPTPLFTAGSAFAQGRGAKGGS